MENFSCSIFYATKRFFKLSRFSRAMQSIFHNNPQCKNG